MPCNTSCTCCEKLLLSQSMTLTSTTLTLNVPTDVSLVNLENYCLVINRCLPVGATTQQILINNGGTKPINLLCKLGNYVRADQLKPRLKYHLVYGADPVHFTVTDCLPRTGYVGTTATSSDDDSSETVS